MSCPMIWTSVSFVVCLLLCFNNHEWSSPNCLCHSVKTLSVAAFFLSPLRRCGSQSGRPCWPLSLPRAFVSGGERRLIASHFNNVCNPQDIAAASRELTGSARCCSLALGRLQARWRPPDTTSQSVGKSWEIHEWERERDGEGERGWEGERERREQFNPMVAQRR